MNPEVKYYQHKINELFKGFAGEMKMPDSNVGISTFGLPDDPHDVGEVRSVTYEVGHFMPTGSGDTLDEAYEQFAHNVHLCLPWPSLKPRFHIFWRRLPQIRSERSFDTDRNRVAITARFGLILDYIDPEIVLAQK